MKQATSDDGARPGWREIAERLRRAIERNELTVGQQIPTETELMAATGSSRYAIRRALTSLQKDGLIRIEQGRGSFVHQDFLVTYRLGERARFTDVLIQDQITPGTEVLRVTEVPADQAVAAALGITPGRAVILMECLGYADGQVVKWDTNYFPLPRFAAMKPTLKTAPSVTAALAAHGVADYKRRSTSIVGRLPTPNEARLLRQLPSNPVFETVRSDVDLAGRPIIFGVTIFSCERVRLMLEAPV
jgi:GntR family phosphonate transport system transcriptional regulator